MGLKKNSVALFFILSFFDILVSQCQFKTFGNYLDKIFDFTIFEKSVKSAAM